MEEEKNFAKIDIIGRAGRTWEFSRQRQEAGKTKANTVHKSKATQCCTEKSRDVQRVSF